MSLTFDFPQWQLRVSGNGVKEAPAGHFNNKREDATMDWAADLAELDGDDDACDRGDRTAAQDVDPVDAQPHNEPEGPPAASSSIPDSGSSSTNADQSYCDGRGGSKLSGGRSAECSGDPQSNAAGPPASCSAASVNCVAVQRGPARVVPKPAPGPGVAPAAISGDTIPSEVLLLVLSGLRDVGDCVRAALVCKHWLAVVTLSNELWYELDSIHLAGGTWHRPPHAGRPLLRPPLGCDHPHSKMLLYKTTCALTQAAVRFMALRKGFEYVVEAAAALWLAAQKAAAEAGGQQPAQTAQSSQLHPPSEGHPAQSPTAAASSRPEGAVEAAAAAAGHARRGDGVRAAEEQDGADGAAAAGGSSGSGGNGSGNDGGGAAPSGSPVSGAGGSGGSRRRRITHVDQLWESCGRSRTALQVDERFNAVRVQQMVGKLCASGGGTWLPLYEGVAAVMCSRCDQIRDQLAAAAAAARDAASTAAAAAPPPPAGAGPKRFRSAAAAPPSGGGEPQHQGGSRLLMLRGEVVYGGGSYADQFAELLRRGDTRGALALGAASQRGAAGPGAGASMAGGEAAASSGGGAASGGVGGGSVHWDLDEPEMREVVLAEEAAVTLAEGAGGPKGPSGGGGETTSSSSAAPPPPIVAEGLLLWQQLLSCWAVYRRWLEVWVVWCGPLGARVEAERQLAGAAAAHGEAPQGPPHLTNKGLMLFRSQVLLAYPLRRPLQAAALWLSERAAHAQEGDGGGGLCGGGGDSGPDGGDGGALSEEEGQLLTGIRKLLTELAVPDDVTQPAPQHTRPKLQRCFGGLLLRPVAGGTRQKLQLAQRMQGLRAAAGSRVGGGGSGAC